ncbi:MAG: hypothetical protein EBU04_06205 [Verrucomicrobia bacterium]|nr:hypothetical protein [Verrucomicrobiota bacterium]NBY36923.1 hypothetical protein [Verrucomicrobiota bacterium]
MPKKPAAKQKTHIKSAHSVVQDALLLNGQKDRTRLQAHAEVAKELGISASMLYKWREPTSQGSGHPNPLERTARLIEVTGDHRIANWIAQRAGGHFSLDETGAALPELSKAANALVKEFGLLIAKVVDAIEDRQITPEETQELRDKWDGLRKRAETFVRHCEKGDYGTKP